MKENGKKAKLTGKEKRLIPMEKCMKESGAKVKGTGKEK
jgi:hypothetical protein